MNVMTKITIKDIRARFSLSVGRKILHWHSKHHSVLVYCYYIKKKTIYLFYPDSLLTILLFVMIHEYNVTLMQFHLTGSAAVETLSWEFVY